MTLLGHRDAALAAVAAVEVSGAEIVAAPVNYLKHLQEAREDQAIHHQNQVGERLTFVPGDFFTAEKKGDSY